MTNPDCEKCHGTGWYFYDEHHAKPCELCCKHDQGWFLLIDHFGKDNGKWCCRAGCGKVIKASELGKRFHANDSR